MMGEAPAPKWLAVDGLLSQFGSDREDAREHYRRFVFDGVGRGIWEGLRQQIYLGDGGRHCAPSNATMRELGNLWT